MNYLDTSYNHLFGARPSLRWWPWVGNAYATSQTRTLLLGESIYEWSPEDRVVFEKRYALSSGLRETHLRHAMDLGRNSPYVRNIERAVFCRSKPLDAQKLGFWTSVSYHNLVLETLPSRKRRHRPSLEHFYAGWEEVLELCELLAVEQVLVYGMSSAHALREVCKNRGINCTVKKKGAAISNCRPRVGVVRAGTVDVKLVFIRHPSEYFSWESWSPVVRANLDFPPLP
jgi:hypothetical protein